MKPTEITVLHKKQESWQTKKNEEDGQEKNNGQKMGKKKSHST